jgi:hypothetical protein
MGKPTKSVEKATNKLTNQSHIRYGKKQKSTLTVPTRMTTYTAPPANWPSKLPFLSVSRLLQALTPLQTSLLYPKNLPADTAYSISSLVTFSPTSNPFVQIRPITDSSHPAYPQFGLFVTKALPLGTHIIDYTGSLHSCPQSTCATSDYDLALLDRDASLAIDSAEMGNEGRFVNDYHGIRDEGPNAVFEEYYVKVRSKGGKETWEARMGIWVAPVIAGKNGNEGISKGEEICVSYGRGWWRARRGLMEEHGEPEINEENVINVGVEAVDLDKDLTTVSSM